MGKGIFCFLLIYVHCHYGISREVPALISWPEEYNYKAETINLISGLVQTFEVWYSQPKQQIRIDFFNGTVKRYMFLRTWVIYMVHPQTTPEGNTEFSCHRDRYLHDRSYALPQFNFTYAGAKEDNGKLIQMWTTVDHSTMKINREFYTYQSSEDIHFRSIFKWFNTNNGQLQEHTIMNYYNFEPEIRQSDLELDTKKQHCSNWETENPNINTVVKNLHPVIPGDVDTVFHRYKNHNKKEYAKEEHELRKLIFERNWSLVNDHNSKNLSYKLELNHFADWTEDEMSYLYGTLPSEPVEGSHSFPHTEQELEEMVKDFPKSLDLREKGFISPVKNQGMCGSCWAFATTASVEGVLSKAYEGYNFELSEQSVVDCAWGKTLPLKRNLFTRGCNGGFLPTAFEYVRREGIPTEEQYGPYMALDGICHVNNVTKTYKIKGFIAITPNSPNALKAALNLYGPVAVSMFSMLTMTFYSHGVYYETNCPADPLKSNHAMVVVGYGELEGAPYWIVKNSYGPAYGEEGYILISAVSNSCNLLKSPYVPIV